MKKIDFANTQPLLMTFTLLNIIYVWLSMTFCTLRKEISKMLNVFKKRYHEQNFITISQVL